jgi:hypothetical protein
MWCNFCAYVWTPREQLVGYKSFINSLQQQQGAAGGDHLAMPADYFVINA